MNIPSDGINRFLAELQNAMSETHGDGHSDPPVGSVFLVPISPPQPPKAHYAMVKNLDVRLRPYPKPAEKLMPVKP